MTHTEPLVWTTQGNLPVASLEYATRWEVTEAYTKFVETYTLNGEIVRESAHVFTKQGLSAEALSNSIN